MWWCLDVLLYDGALYPSVRCLVSLCSLYSVRSLLYKLSMREHQRTFAQKKTKEKRVHWGQKPFRTQYLITCNTSHFFLKHDVQKESSSNLSSKLTLGIKLIKRARLNPYTAYSVFKVERIKVSTYYTSTPYIHNSSTLHKKFKGEAVERAMVRIRVCRYWFPKWNPSDWISASPPWLKPWGFRVARITNLHPVM